MRKFRGDINAPNKTGKWIISGHYPVTFLLKSEISALPIIRNENKTVSIDGGASLVGGQLNAFIIEKASEDTEMVFSNVWADKYPQCVYENEIVSVIDDSCEGYTHIRNSKGEIDWIPKGLGKYF